MPPRKQVAARRARVLQLRAAGLSYAEIAKQVGLPTAAAAAQDATRALAERKGLADDQSALFVTLEAERLDSLERTAQSVMRSALSGGDHETVLKAVDRLVRVSERRGRLQPAGATIRGDAGAGGRGQKPGPVEERVRADIAALITSHPMGEALTEMSYTLARALDEGAGLATAAVNRELRANLAELSRLAVDDSDDLADELSAPDLPAEIRDEPEP
jgi:hypothetical protein